ncbi:MAG: septum formation protein Maf [Marinilabiliales bacterium]|nr:MAG: septum formation protein Maf [Marinilabiliales bacterium]
MKQFEAFNIVLGSGSPRRKKLLEEMGLSFTVSPSQCEEKINPEWDFCEAAENLALQKADAFDESLFSESTILITADTIVCTESEILGKPLNKEEAFEMISSLSGNTHQVITGVCLKSSRSQKLFHVSTDVTFATLTKEEISRYIDLFRPYDKAGAYGIQEWIGIIGVEHIEGSYFNVMGLPTHRLYSELKRFTESF